METRKSFPDKKEIRKKHLAIRDAMSESEKHEKSRKISFTPDASTLMAGDKDSMELETLFFESLEKAFSYSISGKNLTVYSKDGKILLEFIRA